MVDYEFVIRAGAVVAGVALLAGPRLVAAAKAIRIPQQASRKTLTDAHTILEIAGRLHEAGNVRGVELCQNLIDVILSPERKR